MTGQKDVEEISNEIADGDDDDNDNKENYAKIPPTHMQALETLDTVQNYFQFNATDESSFTYLYELEKIISVTHLQKHKQSSIIVFLLNIFRRVQRLAHFSAVQNVPFPFYRSKECVLPIFLQCTQLIFSNNTCTAHFIAKVKWSYLTFIFNLEVHLELLPPC